MGEPQTLREVSQGLDFALSFHNQRPDGTRIECLPGCIACSARDQYANLLLASPDSLRLDPEDPESLERLARALLPGHDFMHEGDRDTCSERDMPAAMEAAERIARAFAAPDPTEDTPNG